MKNDKTTEIELPKPPKNFEWRMMGWLQNNDELKANYELIRTHREDGTPLEIEPIPPMPDNVERVEYFGKGMSPDDMDDADAYIWTRKISKEWFRLDFLKGGLIDAIPGGRHNLHYARIWYKKQKPAPAYKVAKKTQLADLIGEDGQTTCYIIRRGNRVMTFVLNINGSIWRDGLTSDFRWSHSPFTKWEDANEFNF